MNSYPPHTSSPPSTLILCDFDGTINNVDIGHVLLREFAVAGWRKLNRELRAGHIGSKEFYTRIAHLLQGTKEEMEDFILQHSKIDHHFPDFLRLCKKRGWAIKIVSDGFDFYIHTLLGRHRIKNITLFANHAVFSSKKGVTFSFPHHNQKCGSCGNCKLQILRDLRNSYHTIVYVGDGISDRCAIKEADLIFAKKELFKHCLREGIECVRYRNFKNITHYFTSCKHSALNQKE